MAAKATPVAQSDAAEIDRIVAAITASRGVKSASGISGWLADKAADSTRGLARVGAGFSAGVENAAFSFASERERQTVRTAKAILAAARAS